MATIVRKIGSRLTIHTAGIDGIVTVDASHKTWWENLRNNAVGSVQAGNLPTSIELPALPHAVSEFVQKSANPDFEIKALAAIVEKDSALTVELLRHVNSAFYVQRTPVRNVKDAILHIGVNAAKIHLLAAGMKAASRAMKSKLVNQRNFWNESLQRGLFAREVARRLRLDTGLAFLGGLLQDYLLPVLTNHFDKLYLHYLENDSKEGRDLVDWEQETFGWDHASAGAWFASKWNFPDDLLCAIFYHHQMRKTLTDPDPEFFKLFPVAIASLLPDQLQQTKNGFFELLRVDSQCRALGVDELCKIVDEEQMKLAEGYENPNHLSKLLEKTRHIVQQQQAASVAVTAP